MIEIFPVVPASSKPLWVLVPVLVLLAGVLILLGSLVFSTKRLRVEVSEAGLRVRGDIYGRSIPAADLKAAEAEVVDIRQGPYHPRWRTNGVGLPGYLSGWFKLTNKEKALLFVTDPRRVVRIPTRRGYELLVSVADPDRFLERVRRLGT